MAKPISHKGQMLNAMSHVYQDWLASQGLKAASAEEHIADDGITGRQLKWLCKFSSAWEAIESMEE